MRRLPTIVLILAPIAALLVVFFLIEGDTPPPAGPPSEDCQTSAVVRALMGIGVEAKSITSVAGQGECPDVKVALSGPVFDKLSPLIENALSQENLILQAGEKTAGNASEVRWRLQGPGRTETDILFVLPAPPPPKLSGPRAAIIIDDMGYSLEAMDALCRLGRPITASILPFTPRSQDVAARAAACGLETMLHLPLESLGIRQGRRLSVDGTILMGMTPDDIRLAVTEYLDALPGCRGINNHAGSDFTEEASLLQPILGVVKARGLYFIDSRTSRKSVAYEEAVRLGVRAASRQVFLDAEADAAGVRQRLIELFSYAKAHGQAVGIGHPKKETLAGLARHLGLADKMGVRLVFASAVVD